VPPLSRLPARNALAYEAGGAMAGREPGRRYVKNSQPGFAAARYLESLLDPYKLFDFTSDA